ncbi:MAG: metallopeptidase family protein [Pseudomonadota bacterium]
MSHGDHLDLEKIHALAVEARDGLPAPFDALASEVAIRIAETADPEILNALDIDDPMELTGLYEGTPLTEKSVLDVSPEPDVIWLFREPILAEWRERGDVSLADLVGHILVHELAHHLGWSDDDIAAIDAWWE